MPEGIITNLRVCNASAGAPVRLLPEGFIKFNNFVVFLKFGKLMKNFCSVTIKYFGAQKSTRNFLCALSEKLSGLGFLNRKNLFFCKLALICAYKHCPRPSPKILKIH